MSKELKNGWNRKNWGMKVLIKSGREETSEATPAIGYEK